MAQTHISQNKILELLDVFRDYTETGRVTNKINDKLSAQLAYHTATLTTASQQATKTLKKAVNAATTPNNPPTQINQDLISNNQNSQQNIQQNRPSYAAIAAQNKNSTWTTVPARKKPNKKPTSYYQVVLILEQPQSDTPLQIRDTINKSYLKAGIKDPVVREVSTCQIAGLLDVGSNQSA
ncbi:hypothetical protein PtrM4_055560 [Pyrenophora tritici-repentis]|uniref:Uncharacterized protein n=1 Tax=Pyrenophora tritici-repentis TaxID=45151 RepID=A0A834S1Q6_9PLEO|nr:hypothetical protein PtrM4_055560 [Pyrenophora tritici-repentis]